MKILIAEDDVISCKDLEKHLRERDYDGVTTRDGNEAWEFAASNTFRLAIFDWNMPVSDGIEKKYV
jgi:DNA-binding response OmpR family regulator